jgi:hypothetical protein
MSSHERRYDTTTREQLYWDFREQFRRRVAEDHPEWKKPGRPSPQSSQRILQFGPCAAVWPGGFPSGALTRPGGCGVNRAAEGTLSFRPVPPD